MRPSSRQPLPSPRRIFICDDDGAFASELTEALSGQGFAVAALDPSKRPVHQIMAFQPDVLLLDIYMPPPDGFEIVNHLHGTEGSREMTLVLMSGAAMDLLGVATRFCLARNLRVAGSFQKPLKLAELVRACNARLP